MSWIKQRVVNYMLKRREFKESLIILSTPLPSIDLYRNWWDETMKKMRDDPNYLSIKSIPSEKELKEIELD